MTLSYCLTNPNFLTLKDIAKELQCIVSHDIVEVHRKLVKECIVIRPGDHLSSHELKIEVFDSSDQRVSYVLNVNRVTLYFAGDNANAERVLYTRIQAIVFYFSRNCTDSLLNIS